MTNLLPRMSYLFIAAGLAGATLAPVMMAKTAAAAPRYTYSPTLISRYTNGCSDKLRARGKSAAQAQQMCQCSLRSMQEQHTQGQAIGILVKAQFSGSTDPTTGLPLALSKYFQSCKA